MMLNGQCGGVEQILLFELLSFTGKLKVSVMFRNLKNIGREIIAQRGKLSEVITPREQVVGLIRMLRPVLTGLPLVRMGGDGDGGYLVPDDLKGISSCFSPGVGRKTLFEQDCIARGMTVYMADGTIPENPLTHDKSLFWKKNLGVWNDHTNMTFDHWLREANPPDGDLLLQMDIEGGEYELLLNMSEPALNRCRVVVAEFHNLYNLWSKPAYQFMSSAFVRLLRSHACVHIHPNNVAPSRRLQGVDIPPYMEFTFLRKERIPQQHLASHFPHPLDANNCGRDDLPLPPIWYQADETSPLEL